MGKYKVKELGNDNLRTITQITDIAKETEEFGLMGQHATTFEIKLMSMRDDYMRGEWINDAKVLESLGFLEGIAVVQWNLLAAMAEQNAEKLLVPVAQNGAQFHEATMKMLGDASKNYKTVSP
ncbi:MAG: hypothetical protein Q7J78_04935 [Clostridiales bacterium]|nr:hypothetical protein [Clostridiales bacterium]